MPGATVCHLSRPNPHERRGPGRRAVSKRRHGRHPRLCDCAHFERDRKHDRADSRSGGTPLVVATRDKVFGVIHLKDVVKGGIKERFAQLRKMGIRTIMITGDNKLTATAIAPRRAWTIFSPKRNRRTNSR